MEHIREEIVTVCPEWLIQVIMLERTIFGQPIIEIEANKEIMHTQN